MSNAKTILLTGTAGFIGFNVARELLKRGHNVIGVDNFNDYYIQDLKNLRSETLHRDSRFSERRIDISDKKAVDAIFKECKVDLVCNLAAQAGVRYSLINPYVYESSNMAGFLNIIEACKNNGIKRLVYASSSSVYGGNTKIPFSESDSVDNPISLYAVTKRANELTAHAYSHLFGIQTVGLRFFTVYGPWGRPDMAMWIFSEAILKGKKIKLFNYGKMRRDFTYIDDIVSGVCASLFNEGLEKAEIFNLGNHRSEDIAEVLRIIEDKLGKKAITELVPIQAGDVPESFADIEKAKTKLGFAPSTTIREGIPAFLDWYTANPEILEKAALNR